MNRRRILSFRLPAVCLLCWALLGCGLLDLIDQPGSTTPPKVTASALELRQRPTIYQLAQYYCPQVVSDAVVRATCSLVLGPPPPTSALGFSFGLKLTLENPNQIPIPALDVLLALTLFDGQQAEALGAVCLSMCGANDPGCDGRPKAGACESTQPTITKLQDVQARVPGLISDVLSGKALDELRKSTIPAGGNVLIDLTFQLGLDQALRVFQKTALLYVQDLLAGRNAQLMVPVAAHGTVFFDLPVLGRFGVGYGPLRSTWVIDQTVLN